MLTHIRQDVAIRSLPGWLVFGPFLTLSLASLIAIYGSILRDFGLLPTAALEGWVLWLPWLPPAIYLAYAQRRRRASDRVFGSISRPRRTGSPMGCTN